MRPYVSPLVVLVLVAGIYGCAPAHKPPPPSPAPDAKSCKETRLECDSCSKGGILGSRHIHTDCSESCDLICGQKEGY